MAERPAAACSTMASAAADHGMSSTPATIRRCACTSSGATAARSQATAARTSRRSKRPTPPRTWWGTPARSSAAITGRASRRTARISTGLLPKRDALLGEGQDPLDHRPGLPLLVLGPPELGRRTIRMRGDEPLRRAPLDRLHDGSGGGEDRPRRAVVPLEPDLGGGGEALPEVGHVLGGGAAEAVDALIVVADHDERVGAARDQVEELGLCVVGVLELVDQDVARAGGGGRQPIRVRPKERQRPRDREAEVLQPLLLEPAVVRFERPPELQVERPLPLHGGCRRGRERLLGPSAEVLRSDQLVPAPVHAAHEVVHQPDPVAAEVVDPEVEFVQPADEHQPAFLLPDQLPRLEQPLLDAVDPEQLDRVGVEGADAEGLVRDVDRRLGAGSELLRGLPGEGERQDLVGSRTLLDEPRESPAEDPGLAGPRPREHEQGPARMRDGGVLLGCQIVQFLSHRTSHGTAGRGRRRASDPRRGRRREADLRRRGAVRRDRDGEGRIAASRAGGWTPGVAVADAARSPAGGARADRGRSPAAPRRRRAVTGLTPVAARRRRDAPPC